MNNKNVPMETQALEIPNVLGELEDKLEILGQKINTLEERLKNVSRPYKDEPEPDVTGATPLYYTNLGIRIDRSVTSAGNAVERIRNILDFLEV
jgi:hypothetical protein